MLNHKGTIILETKRFILRPFTSEDVVEMYYNWASDREVTNYLMWEEHSDINKTKMIVSFWENSYINKEYYNWSIEEKVSKNVIGSINLLNIDDTNENCEVGFCLGRKFWNQGIMTEVLSKILGFAFNEVKFQRVTARRHVNNIASGMVLRKCKFAYEGTLRKIVKDSRGVFVDCKYYSILKEEYLNSNTKDSEII